MLEGLPKGKYTLASAEYRYGYFYRLSWDDPDPAESGLARDDTVFFVDPTDRLRIEAIHFDYHLTIPESPRCASFPQISHRERKQCKSVIVERGREGRRDGLVYCWEEGYRFVGRQLLSQFFDRKLTGIITATAMQPKGPHEGNWLADDEIVMIDGQKSIYSALTIIPEEANRCELCGFAPLVCPGCGANKWGEDGTLVCWKCGCTWLLKHDAPRKQKQKMRIQEPELFPPDFVDMTQWDGSDFNSGMLVTRRVFDLLKELKCGSFRAQAVAVNVAGLTSEQWGRLEAARCPCK